MRINLACQFAARQRANAALVDYRISGTIRDEWADIRSINSTISGNMTLN